MSGAQTKQQYVNEEEPFMMPPAAGEKKSQQEIFAKFGVGGGVEMILKKI